MTRNQLPIFLSTDAASLLGWARETVDYRDSFSRLARPEQISRITIRPGRLYDGWFLAGQFCTRQATENLGWDSDRIGFALFELFINGLIREDAYFKYEVTALGHEIELQPCAVVAVV